jgi:uncharacterized paraquat-inducible protein A
VSEPTAGPVGCAYTCGVFLLVAAPVYLVMRWIASLARDAYGFGPQEETADAPLRVCPACHNTVLESDYAHCPYCGAELPPGAG